MREALIFAVLSFLSLRDAAVIDSPLDHRSTPNLQLIFNAKHDKIYSLDINPTDPSASSLKPAISITIPLEKCHANITLANLSNIVDFDLTDNDIIWISWNDRIHINDSLLMWYEYYDYQQFSQRRLAVDRASRSIYSIDRFISPWVEVVDFEGRNRRILLSFDGGEKTKDFLFEGRMPEKLQTATFEGMLYEPELPVDIVVDEGLLLAMTRIGNRTRIHKAKLDGTQRALLVPDAGKIANDDCGRLASQNGRIYWTNCGGGAIESVDFDGENRVVVLREESLLAMAVREDWVVWSTSSEDPAMKICRVIDNTCDTNSIAKVLVPELNGATYKIRVRHRNHQPRESSKNCPQLTLNGQCVCRNGHVRDGEKKCVPVTKYLVYESNNFLVSRSLEPYASEEIFNFQPQFVWGLLEKDQVASMDYDPTTGVLFYAECRNLLQLKLEEDMRGCWLVERNDTDCLKHVAYDGRRMNLFLVRQDGTTGIHYLEMVKLTTRKFQRFVYLIPTTLQQVNKPLSLIVHGDFLFLLDDSMHLTIFNITGDHPKRAPLSILPARGLTMDDENARLYWYDEKGTIGYVSFSEERLKVLDGKSPVEGVNAMVVDDEWIYLKNETTIWRMDKNSGGKASCVVAEKKNTKLRSAMKIVKRSEGRLHYQATESACDVFCAYNWDRLDEESHKKDAEFCACLR